MRIAMIGSNGQVAAEVALLLASRPDVGLRPLVRTRGGSAFLRYHGIPVIHGSIADSKLAVDAFAGIDVVANFALAGGSPRAALKENEEIILATFEHSPKSATVVFFSTLAVHGVYDESGRKRKSNYAEFKIKNERRVAALAKASHRKAYILRLGHVAGAYQNITQLCRQEILSPPVMMLDPERPSNVTHTVTIADALIAIGSGRAGLPGHYDLVNVPQWTWRQVYGKEAADIGVPLNLQTIGASAMRPPYAASPMSQMVFGTIKKFDLRGMLTRFATNLPVSFSEVARAEYFVDRARREIAELRQPPIVRNPAVIWPALDIRVLPGLTPTQDLFDSKTFATERSPIARWPADLIAAAR